MPRTVNASKKEKKKEVKFSFSHLSLSNQNDIYTIVYYSGINVIIYSN